MTRISTLLVLLLSLGWSHSVVAATSVQDLSQNTTFNTKLAKKSEGWKHCLHSNPLKARANTMKKTVNKGDEQLGPLNSFGTLFGTDGTEWLYTANFDIDENYSYTGAHLKVYNSKNVLIGTIDTELELGEHQTTINYVAINPNVTQKFFNVNDKYELILFIHATTDDYQGYAYQQVYQLDMNQTKPLMTIPGNEILMLDMAIDEWSERKQMVMMRESMTEDYEYFIHYDIYDRAGWGGEPKLLHTFTMNYANISGSGEAAFPICAQNIGGKAHYAISYYEKPVFDPEIPVWEEPVLTENNNFIIDLYTADDFTKPYKTVKIPVEQEGDYLYSFPSMGALMGNDDFSVGLFGDKKTPYFIITVDNYVTSSDEFVSSFYVYDLDGNRIKTIAQDVTDYVRMADIPGTEMQFCMTNDEEQMFKFVNLPSCELAAEIPFMVGDYMLSMSLDRVPANGSFSYIISASTAGNDAQDNVLHPIAYFNPDGSLNHWDMVNLGKDVQMAQPAIMAEWLSPYLFNTDSEQEYMFLVKVIDNPAQGSTCERLWVLKADGELIADFGPEEALGSLNSISVMNANTNNPVLSVAYYKWQTGEYSLSTSYLPFTKFAGGTGAVNDPFLISSPGDLMQIARKPEAYYNVIKDIDCENYPFNGNREEFTGILNGQNHKIKNLTLVGSGLFNSLVGGCNITDLTFENAEIIPQGAFAGLISATSNYNGSSAPIISNVHLVKPRVVDPSYNGTFGIFVGELTTGTRIQACSVAEADINLPKATVGGIAGEVNPSGAILNAVAVHGALKGQVAGGIFGTVSNVQLDDAHVNATIEGSARCGGIVGELGQYSNLRGTFNNCYVEGNLISTNANDPSLGGIAGTVVRGDNVCLTNNLVALNSLVFNADAEKKTAHRIVGHSRADEPGEILWDDPWWTTFSGDPYEHPELWPREPILADGGFSNNYAAATLQPISGSDDPNSVEGKSINTESITQEFLANTLNFNFGYNLSEPWKFKDNTIYLWFENEELIGTGVAAPAFASTLSLRSGLLTADGAIEIYTMSGQKIATAHNTLSVGTLQPGIYVATAAGQSMKFVVK